jgi:hypothetical protein
MSLPLGLIDSDVSDTDSEASFTSTNSRLNLRRKSHKNDVKAVIVNTNSMMLRSEVPMYTSHPLSPTDDIFGSTPSSISEVFNIPIVTRAVRSKDVPGLTSYLSETQVPNLPVRSLFRQCDVTCCDEDAGIYGWDHEFGKYLLLIDGPVILARQDRKPLHALNVQMILEHVEAVVDPAFEEYHVERWRWRKRVDGDEYREKINEMRGDIEALVKESTMRGAWDKFVALYGMACADMSSPWDD